jgi:hypothetical protein
MEMTEDVEAGEEDEAGIEEVAEEEEAEAKVVVVRVVEEEVVATDLLIEDPLRIKKVEICDDNF